MRYRPEIDGLRALAVLPVILFHAGLGLFRGGFVGVDIFFVISGYLITHSILDDLERGTFTLAGFYERRARRILPALFVMMLVSLVIAWNLLLPADMKDFTRHLAGVALFASNLLFWREAGYWESDNDFNPLLHTWSLAVEEQFYLVFPLLLLAGWRWLRGAWFRLPLLLGVISVLLMEWAAVHAPVANYYLLPTRAWELILGAGVVTLEKSPRVVPAFAHRWPHLREASGFTGLALIIFSLFAIDRHMAYPSLLTLLPTLGAVLILVGARADTLVGRLLTARLLTGIGLLSYSAYLWHQPLLAFARHMNSGTLSNPQLYGIITATFLIAFLSWRYVEQPFRKNAVHSRQELAKLVLACSLAFMALGITGHKTFGFVYRLQGSGSYAVLQEKTLNNFGLNISCEGLSALTATDECRTGASPEILVWGDSYAVHLVQGILASRPEAQLIQLTKSVCGPFLDVAPMLREHLAEACLTFNQQVQDHILSSPSIKYAVLSSPFTNYIDGQYRILSRSGEIQEATEALIDREFRKTLDFLREQGITPVVFSPPPSNGNANIGKCLGRAEYFGKNLSSCNFSLARNSESLQHVFSWLRTISGDYKVVFLDELLCPEGTCQTHEEETFIYRDHGHLTMSGSSMLGKKFDFYNLIVSH